MSSPSRNEDMSMLVQFLQARSARTVLDVGCGTGRYVVYFARQGFTVYGVDSAPTGLNLTRHWLAGEGLAAGLCRQNNFDGLPFATSAVDAVIATQVIHHARLGAIRSLIQDIARILKPAGVAFITVPRLRHQQVAYEEIETGTFMPLNGVEAGLPHHYFTPDELREELRQFSIVDLHLDRTNHYCALAIKH